MPGLVVADDCCIAKGPGPGGLVLPTTVGYENHAVNKWRMPAYTMSGRLGCGSKNAVFPGFYEIKTNLTAKGQYNPQAVSFKGRYPVKNDCGTGALYYPNINAVKWKAPEYSFRTKNSKNSVCQSAGPYFLPTTLKTNGVSFKGKRDNLGNCISPGPYNIGSPDIIKPKAPEVSFKGRGQLKAKPCSDVPYYDIGPSNRGPAFSFRSRHSPCVGIVKEIGSGCDKNGCHALIDCSCRSAC